MGRYYTIQRGDTLGKIAGRFYKDRGFIEKLAEYNGILNPDLIMVGQILEIPSKRELTRAAPMPEADTAGLTPPHGLEAILDEFGNIFEFIQDDGNLDARRWEAENLSLARLPLPIALSWEPSRLVSRLRCHKKLAEIFPEVFDTIAREGLAEEVKTYGGCYNFRSKRRGGKLSTHSWGIAIDLNPLTNPMGRPGDMPPDVVDVFRRFGFKWGGDWPGRSKDPMHFQFCTGY